jgi:hypothetical protein
MRSPELPAVAALVIFSVLLTLQTQIRLRDVPMLVIGTVVITSATVTTLVWAGDVRDVARVWCDIGTS